MNRQTAFDRALAAVGGAKMMAMRFGITRVAIENWRKKGVVPTDRCPAIESATAGSVRCEDLRPDVEWTRDEHGQVTGYRVSVDAAAAMREVA